MLLIQSEFSVMLDLEMDLDVIGGGVVLGRPSVIQENPMNLSNGSSRHQNGSSPSSGHGSEINEYEDQYRLPYRKRYSNNSAGYPSSISSPEEYFVPSSSSGESSPYYSVNNFATGTCNSFTLWGDINFHDARILKLEIYVTPLTELFITTRTNFLTFLISRDLISIFSQEWKVTTAVREEMDTSIILWVTTT